MKNQTIYLKKFKAKYFLIAFLILMSSLASYAQTANVTDAYVVMDDAQAPGALDAGTYFVFVSDTNVVSEIEVKLGTGESLGDIMSNTFTYDVTSGLPNGYSYLREGNKLTLGIGNYVEKNTYFGSVRVKNNLGVWSSTYNFITN